jgi:hypothetical protein
MTINSRASDMGITYPAAGSVKRSPAPPVRGLGSQLLGSAALMSASLSEIGKAACG